MGLRAVFVAVKRRRPVGAIRTYTHTCAHDRVSREDGEIERAQSLRNHRSMESKGVARA